MSSSPEAIVQVDEVAIAASTSSLDQTPLLPSLASTDLPETVSPVLPSITASSESAVIGGMTDAEKMETKTLDLITEMEKKIMDHENEKREWEDHKAELEEIVASLRERLRMEESGEAAEGEALGGEVVSSASFSSAATAAPDSTDPGASTAVSLATVLEEKRVLIEEASAYQKERDQLTNMISTKHQECLDYYQQLTNFMTAYQQVSLKRYFVAMVNKRRFRSMLPTFLR